MSVIKLDSETYFSTDDGIVISKENAMRITKKTVYQQRNLTINETINKIIGRDSIVIPLKLLGRNNTIDSSAGFFITVYLSGSDGTLKRMYREDIVNPADNASVRGGFEQYIDLEVDI